MLRAFASALFFIALAACASSGQSLVPQANDANTQRSFVGRLTPDDGAYVKANVSIAIRSAEVVYEYQNKDYAKYLNGSCTIRRVGNRAVGCIVEFYFEKSVSVQKAQIGLRTKPDAKGCLAALSPVYKDLHFRAGEEREFKTFSWTGNC